MMRNLKNIIKNIVFALFIVCGYYAAAQEDVEPSVFTYAPTTVTSESAKLNGGASAGTETIGERGFQWKLSSETNWTTITMTEETPVFQNKIENLTPETSYTFRTYIVVNNQYYYGEPYTFVTKSNDQTSGANLDLLMNDVPNFNGWTAKTGKYNGSGKTSPPFSFSKEWDPPTNAKDGGTSWFAINNDTTKTDSYSNNKLKIIPTHLGYERSIRLHKTTAGDDCSEISYKLRVKPENCLVTFNYAMVLELPHKGEHFVNPTFEVDVVPADDESSTVHECTFFQMCGDIDTKNLPDGWHAGKSGFAYCDWQQIKINLALFDGQDVLIRARVSGCTYGGHLGYGYFVAKTEGPNIELAGCAGAGDTVNVAEAPGGFDAYEWFELDSWNEDQNSLASLYDAASADNKILSTDSLFAITTGMMGEESEKFYAVKLTSPTQHVKWDKDPAPACESYIPIRVLDMRPNFSMQEINKYIPADPKKNDNKVGFLFTDVKERKSTFPLDWQKMDFGDGNSLEFVYDEASAKWNVDETKTPLTANKCEVSKDDLGNLDTIYHIYEEGDYIYNRTAHAIQVGGDLTCERTEGFDVHVGIIPSIRIIARDTICVGDSVKLDAISPEEDITNYVYEWFNGSDNMETATPVFTGTSLVINSLDKDTTFLVRVTNKDELAKYNDKYPTNDTRVTVCVQDFPKIRLEGDSIICIGENLKLSALDMSGYALGLKWTFQRPNSATVVGVASNPAVFNQPVKQDTVLYILAETTRHCINWDSVNVTVIIPQVTADKKSICPGQEVVLTGYGAETYSWTSVPNDATLTENVESTDPVTVKPEQTTTYTMTGYGPNGCSASTGISIKVIPYPIPKIVYTPAFVDVDDPTLVITDSSEYAYSSKWTFSDGGTATGRSAIYSFSDLTSETVSIMLESANELGCSASTSVDVPVVLFSVWMPTAFTPDGDGINDYFFPVTENNLVDVTFEIFNRWGTKMYSYSTKLYEHNDESDPSKYGWDGKFNDEFVQNGVYVWRLSYKREGSTKIYDRKGTIHVMR